jgi:hypothetical protein
VLLDTFISTRQMHDEERMEERVKDLVERGTIRSALDPLLECLAKEYTDDADLSHRLHELFKARCREGESEGEWERVEEREST